MKESKLIYIASPYAGDIEKNVVFAQRACIPQSESLVSGLDNSFCGGVMNYGCAVTGLVPAWHGKFPRPIT